MTLLMAHGPEPPFQVFPIPLEFGPLLALVNIGHTLISAEYAVIMPAIRRMGKNFPGTPCGD
jgi:hypothetical protein